MFDQLGNGPSVFMTARVCAAGPGGLGGIGTRDQGLTQSLGTPVHYGNFVSLKYFFLQNQ